MRIDSAESERVHPGSPGMSGGGGHPRPRFRVDIERGCAGGQRIDWLAHVKRGREHLVMQRQGGLDHAGDSRSRHQVPDHRLDGAKGAPRQVPVASAEHVLQRIDLRGVADRRAGAMCLDQADRAW